MMQNETSSRLLNESFKNLRSYNFPSLFILFVTKIVFARDQKFYLSERFDSKCKIIDAQLIVKSE